MRIKTRQILSGIVISGLLSVGTLFAVQAQNDGKANSNKAKKQKKTTSFQQSLRNADANSDGVLQLAEFEKAMKDVFAANDQNQDGQLEAQEIRSLLGQNKVAKDQAANAPTRQNQMGMGIPQQNWERLVQRFDADKNGKLTQQEWQGPGERFSEMDVNGDGALETKEATCYRFLNADANQDGLLNADEFPYGEDALTQMDGNGDGQLSMEEMEASQKAFVEKMNQARQERMNAANNRREQIFDSLDGNADGVLSQDELQSRPGLMQKLDADQDGTVTREEMEMNAKRRGPQSMGPRHGQGFQAFNGPRQRRGMMGSGAGQGFSHGQGPGWNSNTASMAQQGRQWAGQGHRMQAQMQGPSQGQRGMGRQQNFQAQGMGHGRNVPNWGGGNPGFGQGRGRGQAMAPAGRPPAWGQFAQPSPPPQSGFCLPQQQGPQGFGRGNRQGQTSGWQQGPYPWN